MKVNFSRIVIPNSKESIINLLMKFTQCKICMNILNDPYDCICCNQTFCKSCIINYIKANNKCPFSEFFNEKKKNKTELKKTQNLISKLKQSSSNFIKAIQSLKFYCKNFPNGCQTELNIEEISQHEKICQYNNSNYMTQTKNDNRDDNMKHHDSIVSFSGFKYTDNNFIDDNKNKYENIIDDINQKLTNINNFITNYCDNNSINSDRIRYNKDNDSLKKSLLELGKTYQKERPRNKAIKKESVNSMTITNNFFDSSYISTVNNFSHHNLKKTSCIPKLNKGANQNKKLLSFNTKQHKLDLKLDKINKKTNAFNEKFKTKRNKFNKKEKKIFGKLEKKLPDCSDKKEKEKEKNKIRKEDDFSRNKISENINTPKLGTTIKEKHNEEINMKSSIDSQKYYTVNNESNEVDSQNCSIEQNNIIKVLNCKVK